MEILLVVILKHAPNSSSSSGSSYLVDASLSPEEVEVLSQFWSHPVCRDPGQCQSYRSRDVQGLELVMQYGFRLGVSPHAPYSMIGYLV